MSDELTLYERLAAPFALEDHAKVSKGAGSQTYAPWTAYVERLNVELGQDWSFRAIREGFTESECWVLGEITAIIDGVATVRQQYGCEPIALGQKPNGDLLKKAATDAVKKAASLLGVGLYLSIKEEREAIEAEMQAAVRAEAQKQADEGAAKNRPAPNPTPRPSNSAAPAGRATASTPAASGAAPSSSSTTATSAPTPINEKARDSAILTGANPNALQQRWQRLVSEAERIKLPKLGQVKAIDPKAISDAQLKSYADLLENRIYEAKGAA